MDNMGHDKKEPVKDDPWPILYGSGGFILVVIVIAGIMKFTGLKRQGVN